MVTLPPRPAAEGIWHRWHAQPILALAVPPLAGTLVVQVAGDALTGGLAGPVPVGSLVGGGGPLLGRARSGELLPATDLGWRLPTPRQLWLTTGIALAALPPASLLAELSLRLRPADPEWVRLVNEQMPRGAGPFVLAALAMVIVAPLVEEIIFRALLQRLAARYWGALPGALVSALLFGLVHLEPWYVLGLIGVGLMLALVWAGTRSLPACWLAHALHNGVSLALLADAGGVTGEPGDLAVRDLLLAGGGLAIVAILGRNLLRR